jgi:hypothetical protein
MAKVDKAIRRMYHCTVIENMYNIKVEGLQRGMEGVIYLAEKPEDAAKFLAVRGIAPERMRIIEIHRRHFDEGFLEESTDHSERFFGCKAYMYGKDIPAKIIRKCNVYVMELKGEEEDGERVSEQGGENPTL